MALELPNQYDPKNGGAPNMRGAFDGADSVRRMKMDQDVDAQQAFFRQMSGAAADTGEMTTNGNASHASTLEAAKKAKDKSSRDATDLQMLLALQNEIADFEGGLEGQYGENFALDLVADLVEQEIFTQEQYEQFASIEDENERRIAIAAAIQKGLDDGTIKPENLDGHPWTDKWLDMHERAVDLRDNDKQLAMSGQKSEHDIAADSQDEATYETSQNSNVEGRFEVAVTSLNQSAEVDTVSASPFAPV